MAARPDTPPGTPDRGKGTGPGPADVHGDVDFKGANINNAIATGHIYGYEVILATINVTVDAANNLNKNIQEIVANVDLQLDLISSKVGDTANLLGLINALVVKQAKKKGLTVNKEVKVRKKIRHEGTGRGNEVGTPEEVGQDEILSLTCFRGIIERTEGTHKTFDDISEKINKAIGLLKKMHQDGQEAVTGVSVRGPRPDAQSAQRHPRTPKGKVGLSDEDRKTVRLTEKDLFLMEKIVEIHWKDLFNRFIIFEYSLDHERQDKNVKDIESIKQKLESVKLVGKATWKEIKRLAKYLRDNDKPPLDEFQGPQTRQPPEALRRYIPKPSRVNSLYVGWEFRKSLPLPPPHPYGRLDQPSQKPSWRFAVPQRMPFSTEELFLRVLAQAAQRTKSDRTLRDEYWGALKKAGQRALVDELVRAQNHHLQRDFPELEWTIAGLETKSDPWALIAAHSRSRAREKKTRTAITAFEVILKTQWHITRGYGPPMPSGGGAGGGQGVPIITTADAWIPVHSQTRSRESTQSKHRPTMMLREPKWVMVKEKGKNTKKSKDNYYAELREPGRYYRTAAADPSSGGHRPSSPPGPGICHRTRLVQPLKRPPPSRPSSGFVPANGGHWRAHVPLVTPVARPSSPQPIHIHVSSAQTQREEEEEEEKEAEDVVNEIFEEFSELTDNKGKVGERADEGRRMGMEQGRPGPRGDRGERGWQEQRRRQRAGPHVSISMSLMREVERESSRRLTEESDELLFKSVTLERMAERQAPPPPAFVAPGPAERTRPAREREPTVVHVAEPPLRPYVQMEIERRAEERRRDMQAEMDYLRAEERRRVMQAERELQARERRRDMQAEMDWRAEERRRVMQAERERQARERRRE